MFHSTIPLVASFMALGLQALDFPGDWLQQGSFGLLAFVIFYMMRYGVAAIESISRQMSLNTVVLTRLHEATQHQEG